MTVDNVCLIVFDLLMGAMIIGARGAKAGREAGEHLYLETLPTDERDALLSREIPATAVEVNA